MARIEGSINISNLISFLKKKGIESTISNTALHVQPYYKRKYGFKKNDFKNSLFASKNSLALPIHSRMKEKDFIKIANTLEEYL